MYRCSFNYFLKLSFTNPRPGSTARFQVLLFASSQRPVRQRGHPPLAREARSAEGGSERAASVGSGPPRPAESLLLPSHPLLSPLTDALQCQEGSVLWALSPCWSCGEPSPRSSSGVGGARGATHRTTPAGPLEPRWPGRSPPASRPPPWTCWPTADSPAGLGKRRKSGAHRE